MSRSQVLMCFLLAILFLHVTAATMVAHVLNISFAAGNEILIETELFKILYPLLSVLRNVSDFLQNNHLPPWLIFTTVTAAVSPHFCQTLSAILLALIGAAGRTIGHQLDQGVTIAELQRQLSERCAMDRSQQQRSNENVQLRKELEATRCELLSSKGQLKISQDAGILKDKRIRELQTENAIFQGWQEPASVRARKIKAKEEIQKAYQRIDILEEENADLDEKYYRAQQRLSEEQWDSEERRKLERRYEAKLDEKQHMVDQQAKTIAQLKSRPTLHQNQHHVTILHSIVTVIFHLLRSENEMRQMLSIFFVAAIKESGIDLTHLGIDPQLHQEYMFWAEAMQKNLPCLKPSTGLHLQDTSTLFNGTAVSNEQMCVATAPQTVHSSFDQPAGTPQDDNNTSQISPADEYSDTGYGSEVFRPGTFRFPPPTSSLALGQSSTLPVDADSMTACSAPPDLPSTPTRSVLSQLRSAGETDIFRVAGASGEFEAIGPTIDDLHAAATAFAAAYQFDSKVTGTLPSPPSKAEFDMPSTPAPAVGSEESDTPSALPFTAAAPEAQTEGPATTDDSNGGFSPGSSNLTTDNSGPPPESSNLTATRAGIGSRLRHMALKRTTASHATMSTFSPSRSSKSRAVEGDTYNKPSEMSKYLPPLFGQTGLQPIPHGPFNTATWRYNPSTPSPREPSWAHLEETPLYEDSHPYAQDPEFYGVYAIHKDKVNARIGFWIDIHPQTDWENFMRKVYQKQCIYRKRSDAVHRLGSVYRSTGGLAKSRGADLLRKVQTRVKACRVGRAGRERVCKR